MKAINSYTYADLEAILKERGYAWFTKTYDLNIIGIRSPNQKAGVFDDWLYVAYNDQHAQRLFGCPITTDPLLYYLRYPMNVKGTAIVAPGQYRGLWKRGLHKGTDALVQVKPVTVIRDNNRDDVLDWNSANKETGLFGINLHYARGDKASAGCQVVPNIRDLAYILSLNTLQREHIGSGSQSYTLLEQRDL